jgi:hypothetical protein
VLLAERFFALQVFERSFERVLVQRYYFLPAELSLLMARMMVFAPAGEPVFRLGRQA